jgi:hypothetical protein
MKSLKLLIFTAALAGSLSSAQAAFVISASPGPFVPSFRDPAGMDAGNTTWFGWGSGSFDGSTDNELIDNPLPTLGTGGLNGTLAQVGALDILSSSNNIYVGTAQPEALLLGVPTNGTVGTGFTTLIIQGRTAFGAYNTDMLPSFGAINGILPTGVTGVNSTTAGQFFVKYELPGNAASYSIPINLPGGNGISINQLVVDTQWSANGFAADLALVPEPTGAALLLLAGLSLGRRRRSSY